MSYIETGSAEYKRASGALFIGAFVTFAILYTTQPLMPEFAAEFHVSAPLASLTLSLSTGVMAVAMLGAASLSDKVGKKNIMVFSMFSTSILSILTAYSPNFFILLLLRASLGIFIAGVPSIAMAYVAEEFNPNGIGKMMGLYISGTSIGGMAGRIITGVLTDAFSWRFAILAIGIITLGLSVLFYISLPAPRRQANRPHLEKTGFHAYVDHVKNKPLLLLIMLPFLLMGSFVTLFNYIGFLLKEPPYHLSQTAIGFIFILYLFGTFSSVYMGKKADLYGSSVVIKMSLTIMILGAIVTMLPSLVGKVVGIAIFTFGFFASHSVASSWMGEFALKNKAQASSLYLFSYYIGSSIVGSVGGFFWQHHHWGGVIGFVSMLMLFAFSIVYLIERSHSSSAISQYQSKVNG
ncbi:MFS transporter [Bacillus sp. DNRA2]|uniref:MFS transporter n=1 Tax=Bacillus sp. DNRA2 TaxID=2723053 RepID=UPI00145D5A4E|nr:MFS transporter [Bacillus sp. DNRA2]NMD69240.1 MFS transporter [Bacillus sp. DNRA2]